jgi:hypothetical protein
LVSGAQWNIESTTGIPNITSGDMIQIPHVRNLLFWFECILLFVEVMKAHIGKHKTAFAIYRPTILETIINRNERIFYETLQFKKKSKMGFLMTRILN